MEQVKIIAKQLAAALTLKGYKSAGEDISHGHSLDLISKVLGDVKDWNALAARLKNAPDAKAYKALIEAAEQIVSSYDNTGCDGCGVVDESAYAALESRLEAIRLGKQFVIASESEEGFWSNEGGWGALEGATVYTEAESKRVSLPTIGVADAKWVPIESSGSYLEREARYIRHSGVRCPCCHSDSLTGSEWNSDGGIATQDVGCDECNAQWQDVYTLTGLDVQDEGDAQAEVDQKEIFGIEMHSGEFGSEFFNYGSKAEMSEGLWRLMTKTASLEDDISRNFWEVTGHDVGDAAIRGVLLASWNGKSWSHHGKYTASNQPEHRCRQCDSDLKDGYCVDVTCSYNDWPQQVSLYQLDEMTTEEVELRYGIKKRAQELDDDKFQCVHCGGVSDIEDSVQTEAGLICVSCSTGKTAFEAIVHESNAAPKKSVTELRREAAEQVFQKWNFPLPVAGHSGWDCSEMGDTASWSKSVFLENEMGGGDSIRVGMTVNFKGYDIVSESCNDQYGEDCGHGALC